jgi:hypothetical protein
MAAELFPVRQEMVDSAAPVAVIAQISCRKHARFTDSSPSSRGVFPCYGQVTREACVMADILVVIGIIGFVAAMLSVIFGLGRADRRRLDFSGAVDRRRTGVSASAQQR